MQDWQNLTGNPSQGSSWTDYIPNIFGGQQQMIPGLLTPEQQQSLSRGSNIAGLLGIASALSQGMSSVGPRRSAAQNILSALGAGYGAAGGAYQQGVQNIAAQQQMIANQEKQQAFADIAKKYPELAPLARLAPDKFVEMVTQLEKQKPISEAYKQAGIVEPTQQVSPELSQYMVGGGEGMPVVPSAEPIPGANGERPIAQGAGVITAPVPTEAGYGALPQAPAVNIAEQKLRSQKDWLLRVNAKLASAGTKEANDEIKNNLEQIKGLDTQIQQLAVGGFDFKSFKNTLPEEFRARVDSLQQLADKGLISGNELRLGLNEISNAAQLKTADIQDYQYAKKQGFKGSYEDWVKFVGEARSTKINLPSEGERTAGFLTNRVQNALQQINSIVTDNPKAAAPSMPAELIKKFTGSDYLKNLANPEYRQRVEAAQLELLDSALTLGTGAAYTKEQIENYRRSYFPQLGDKPETIKDKAKRLEVLLQSARIKAGRAAPSESPALSPLEAINQELERRKGR